MRLARILFWFAAPVRFAPLARALQRPLRMLAAIAALAGLYLGFVATPPDAVQGNAYRIIYLHVPAAWVAMLVYALLAFWSFVGLVWRTRLSHLLAQALVPTGALHAALCLATGALWGQPMWGTWWAWDARLTSSLLLLLMYLGLLALRGAIDDPARGDRACAVLALLGALNLPVLYFSVQWWNTLHQSASITPRGASMPMSMLVALLLCTLAAWAWAAATVLRRTELLIAQREAQAHWLQRLQAAEMPGGPGEPGPLDRPAAPGGLAHA